MSILITWDLGGAFDRVVSRRTIKTKSHKVVFVSTFIIIIVVNGINILLQLDIIFQQSQLLISTIVLCRDQCCHLCGRRTFIHKVGIKTANPPQFRARQKWKWHLNVILFQNCDTNFQISPPIFLFIERTPSTNTTVTWATPSGSSHWSELANYSYLANPH